MYYSSQNEHYYSDNETTETDSQYESRKDSEFEESYTATEKMMGQMKDILKNSGSSHLLDGVTTYSMFSLTKQNENIFETVEDLESYLEEDKLDTNDILNGDCIGMTQDDFIAPGPLVNENIMAVLRKKSPVWSRIGPKYSRNCFGRLRKNKFEKVKAAHEFKDRMMRTIEVQDSIKRKMELQLKDIETKRDAIRNQEEQKALMKKQMKEAEKNRKQAESDKKNTKKTSFLNFLMSGKSKLAPIEEETKVVTKTTEEFNYTSAVKSTVEPLNKMTTTDLLSLYIGAPAQKHQQTKIVFNNPNLQHLNKN